MKKFLLLAAWMAISGFADARTSQLCFRYPGCHEANPLLGRHPSATTLYTVRAATTGGAILGTYLLRRKENRFWMAPGIALSGVSTWAAFHNEDLADRLVARKRLLK